MWRASRPPTRPAQGSPCTRRTSRPNSCSKPNARRGSRGRKAAGPAPFLGTRKTTKKRTAREGTQLCLPVQVILSCQGDAPSSGDYALWAWPSALPVKGKAAGRRNAQPRLRWRSALDGATGLVRLRLPAEGRIAPSLLPSRRANLTGPSAQGRPAYATGYHSGYQPQGCAIPIAPPLQGAPIGTLRALAPDARLLWFASGGPVSPECACGPTSTHPGFSTTRTIGERARALAPVYFPY